MVIKVRCCKCNKLLWLRVREENRRKATNAKKFAIGKIQCKTIGSHCKSK